MSRRRYVYRKDPETGEVRSYDISEAPPLSSGRLELMTGSFYDGQVTDEGRDISSRAKFRAFMAENGLAHASDYSKEFLRKRREGTPPEVRKREVRETVAKAWDYLSRGRRG